MIEIFISYRRPPQTSTYAQEDRFWIRSLVLGLKKFGERKVDASWDKDFPYGEDFRNSINNHIRQADVIIVAMTKSWIERQSELHNDGDWVYYELLRSLEQKKYIVPVLLGKITLPNKKDLPEDLRELLFKNATIIPDDDQLEDKVREIINDIKTHFRKQDEYWKMVNGLNGVLHLVESGGIRVDDLHDILDWMMLSLVPELDERDADDKKEKLQQIKENLKLEQVSIDYSFPLFEDSSYIALALGTKRILQIGVTDTRAIQTYMIYERFESLREASILIARYSLDEDMNVKELEALAEILEEPLHEKFYSVSYYRLPYKSIFVSQIQRRKNATYAPYPNGGVIGTDTFGRLFKLGWIGSKLLDKDKLKQIHKVLRFCNARIIHALEFDKNDGNILREVESSNFDIWGNLTEEVGIIDFDK